ncbi:DUF2332 domain-containing protein [Actinophytocola oryzae]|uniref:Uncharacterized protein DUF2332 n=1 Tax=Actinophytocola oryzae TaxID=502181 RepID=A0A4R7VFG1_9PSEU|nr:DUF2332 domain-containing protein [Actinophytocola oryzae]TDV47835.1 uncharacterized protein DUF2332 [Actinophytocola oryzae]
MSTAEEYRRFGVLETRATSPCYEEWSLGVADDVELIALLDELPEPKRQPNLLFAAARYLGVPAGPFAGFRRAVLERWPEVAAVMLAKRTQTNEPGRCAVLLPLLAALPQPLALLEVGASAGLCLFPDRYSYRYPGRDQLDPADGPSPAVLECETTGPVPFPTKVPEIAWRAGIDLNPLDVGDPDTVRWLETLIWPEHDYRRTRLAAAIGIVREHPPLIVAGDLNEQLTAVAATAPEDATLVVFHSAVLPYLSADERERFIATVKGLDAHWIANEGMGVVLADAPPSPEPDKALFLVTHNGEPVAYAAGHGQSLHWLAR